MDKRLLYFLALVLFFTSCKKEYDDLELPPLSEYYPLTIGNYIDYDLDSLIFTNFGQNLVHKQFEAREIVADSINDLEGNVSYRIDRYLRTNSNQSWQPSMSYIVTPKRERIEVVENNLRYIKMVLPISSSTEWNGNSFIDTKDITQDLRFMDGWNYQYDSIGAPLSMNGLSLNNTLKVEQADETIGGNPTDPGTSYGERIIGYEKYASGIGLVEREFTHWVYQGAVPGRAAFYNGFGIKMTVKGFGSD